jgi:hypothetical protein
MIVFHLCISKTVDRIRKIQSPVQEPISSQNPIPKKQTTLFLLFTEEPLNPEIVAFVCLFLIRTCRCP